MVKTVKELREEFEAAEAVGKLSMILNEVCFESDIEDTHVLIDNSKASGDKIASAKQAFLLIAKNFSSAADLAKFLGNNTATVSTGIKKGQSKYLKNRYFKTTVDAVSNALGIAEIS